MLIFPPLQKPLFLLLSTQLVHGPNFDVPIEHLEGHMHHNTFNRVVHSAQATILDGVVEAVIKSLKKNQMWKNSVLIFSSGRVHNSHFNNGLNKKVTGQGGRVGGRTETQEDMGCWC